MIAKISFLDVLKFEIQFVYCHCGTHFKANPKKGSNFQ